MQSLWESPPAYIYQHYQPQSYHTNGADSNSKPFCLIQRLPVLFIYTNHTPSATVHTLLRDDRPSSRSTHCNCMVSNTGY